MKSKRLQSYIVATTKPWNITEFKKVISLYPGTWHLVTDPEKLTLALVQKIQPRYIFFPHWSWKVPKEILDAAECVCFHEADVPYGRGGSPIQNLIMRGHKKTVITALRMEEGMDTGPVYLKVPLSLSGNAQEIFERAAPIVAKMIRTITMKEIMPKPQRGTAVVFKRRTPEESNIALLKNPTTNALYDLIRMLDAETYPHAYIENNRMRYEFANAKRENGKLHADVTITKKKA